MSTLTPEGQRLVQETAQRHGFGEEAVTRMLAAVAAGGGRMAQFDHPEFGGSGQWMAGGMLMLGDMFNHSLKARVEGLCTDLASALDASGPMLRPATSQSQSQGEGQGRDRGRAEGGERNRDDADRDAGRSAGKPLFADSSPSGSWWPRELGTPTATGSQNATRYAYFADAHRLAVQFDGQVRVHDTLDHRIGGFSQQQGGRGGMSMSSQHGTVDLDSLPVVSGEGQGGRSPRATEPSREEATSQGEAARSADAARSEAAGADGGAGGAASRGPGGPEGSAPASGDDPLRLVERLGELHERGLLTDEEFAAKKRELLSRL